VTNRQNLFVTVLELSPTVLALFAYMGCLNIAVTWKDNDRLYITQTDV